MRMRTTAMPMPMPMPRTRMVLIGRRTGLRSQNPESERSRSGIVPNEDG